MLVDIYTKKPIELDSSEHIVPSFLGGRLQRYGLLDKTTNDAFGSGIEADLDRALHSFRVLTDARSHRSKNEPPPAIRRVRAADGKDYEVHAGGEARIPPRISVKPQPDGSLQVTGTASDVDALTRAIAKAFRHKGWGPEKIRALKERFTKEGIHEKWPTPEMTFSVPLYQDGPYRATAKIACNLVAVHDRTLFLRSEFDGIRSYVLDGHGVDPHPVHAVDIDLRVGGIGRLDHFVAVESTSDGAVVGLVVYFGALAFVVKLADGLSAVVPRRTYRVDQLGQAARQDHSGDHAVVIPSFPAAAAMSFEDYAELARPQLDRTNSVVHAIQQELWIRRVLGPYDEPLRQMMAAPDRFSLSDRALLARQIAHAITDEMMPRFRQVSERRRRLAEEEFRKALGVDVAVAEIKGTGEDDGS